MGPQRIYLYPTRFFSWSPPDVVDVRSHDITRQLVFRLRYAVGPVLQFHPHLIAPGYVPFLEYPLTLAAPSNDTQHMLAASRRCGIDAH